LFLSATLSSDREKSRGRNTNPGIARLSALLDTASVLVMKATEMHPRTNDVSYPYPPGKQFPIYDRCDGAGLLLPSCTERNHGGRKKARSVPFCRKMHHRRMPGANTVLDPAAFQQLFKQAAESITTLYYSAPDIRFPPIG